MNNDIKTNEPGILDSLNTLENTFENLKVEISALRGRLSPIRAALLTVNKTHAEVEPKSIARCEIDLRIRSLNYEMLDAISNMDRIYSEISL